MNEQEKKYLAEIIARAIADGCVCSVHDGECYTVSESRDHAVILEALGTTDEDHLILHNNIGRNYVGTVFFVYGNEPEEVVNDYGWDQAFTDDRMKAIVGEYK